MKRDKCSEDCFDAIFECSCSQKLCSKHYFSHQMNFPYHNIDRIKIPINNESKQILINFIIKIKQKLASLSKTYIELDIRIEEFYQKVLITINYWFECLDSLLLFLMEKQWIPMQLFFTPFEYFLHQPADKASKYVNEFIFPANFSDFLTLPWKNYLFNFNYFIFEDTNYIFGWRYDQAFNKRDLEYILFQNLESIFNASEFEMAYEILFNLWSLKVIEDPLNAQFLWSFKEIVYNFIKEKRISNLEMEWKKVEEDSWLLKWTDNYYWWFYRLSLSMFDSLRLKNLVSYCIEKLELNCWDNSLQKENCMSKFVVLAKIHWNMGNFKIAKKFFKRFIKSSRNFFNNTILEAIICSYAILISYYFENKKTQKIKKIIKIIERIEKLNNNKHELDETLYLFYYKINEVEKAFKILFRLIKIYRKKGINNSSSLSWLHMHLGWIYQAKNDTKKALQSLSYAKSCIEMLPPSYPIVKMVYMSLGDFYLQNRYYKDAMEHYQIIISYCQGDELKKIKHNIGLSYFYLANYGKSLKNFLEVESFYSSPNENKTEHFQINTLIGRLYCLTGNEEKASFYYQKAFELITSIDINWKYIYHIALDFTYFYFYEKKDYEKCEAILQLKTKLSNIDGNWVHKVELFIFWSELYNSQNKREEAEEYFLKAEKLIDLENFLLFPKRRINPSCIRNFKWIANHYLVYKKDYEKAEKICKALESAFDVSLPIYAFEFYKVFELLQELHIRQKRWIEAKEYNQKILKTLEKINQSEIFNLSAAKTEANIRKHKKIEGLINQILSA